LDIANSFVAIVRLDESKVTIPDDTADSARSTAADPSAARQLKIVRVQKKDAARV
jgi:hypothetical protein